MLEPIPSFFGRLKDNVGFSNMMRFSLFFREKVRWTITAKMTTNSEPSDAAIMTSGFIPPPAALFVVWLFSELPVGWTSRMDEVWTGTEPAVDGNGLNEDGS
jgi:hypothetical protein